MDAFANIPSNGKFAMKFDAESEDRLIGVALLEESDDVLLATLKGKAIRFAGDDVREFTSRTSTGVRGMKFKEKGDEVVSLSILHGGSATPEERDAYLKVAPWKADDGAPALSDDHAAMVEEEQFILTVCANGYGKLSSAYEYRRAGRGGMGITNIDNIKRNGEVVASFTATRKDQLMLVTDQAKLIRIGLDSLRVIGRGSAGVRLFDVAKGETIVGAVRIEEPEEEDTPDEAETAPEINGDEGQIAGDDAASGGDSDENQPDSED